MVRINLLPWRDRRRDKQQKRFIVAVTATLASALMTIYIAYAYQQAKLAYQNRRNAFLQEEVTKLDFRIRKIKEIDKKIDKLKDYIKIIEELKKEKFKNIILINEIRKVTPDGVFFRKLRQSGQKISLYGEAVSENAIADLIRNIEESKYFVKPKLKIIEKQKRVKSFNLNAKFIE